jgi:hypothetical protein
MRSLGTFVEDSRSNLSRRKFYKTFCPALFVAEVLKKTYLLFSAFFYWYNVAGEKPANGSGGKSLNSRNPGDDLLSVCLSLSWCEHQIYLFTLLHLVTLNYGQQ